MADDGATAAATAMDVDVVDAAAGGDSRKNSVEMPLADELTAGAVGFADEGPEEVRVRVQRGAAPCLSCVRPVHPSCHHLGVPHPPNQPNPNQNSRRP